MRVLFTQFWPALIPIAIFILWYVFFRKKHKDQRLSPAQTKLWLVTLTASVIIMIATLAFVVLNKESNVGETYIPPHYEKGVIVPGHTVKE